MTNARARTSRSTGSLAAGLWLVLKCQYKAVPLIVSERARTLTVGTNYLVAASSAQLVTFAFFHALGNLRIYLAALNGA